jgi:hypothetical protein
MGGTRDYLFMFGTILFTARALGVQSKRGEGVPNSRESTLASESAKTAQILSSRLARQLDLTKYACAETSPTGAPASEKSDLGREHAS